MLSYPRRSPIWIHILVITLKCLLSKCPDGHSEVGDVCYKVFRIYLTWEDAKKWCTANKMYIAWLKNPDNSSFERENLTDDLWVGARRDTNAVAHSWDFNGATISANASTHPTDRPPRGTCVFLSYKLGFAEADCSLKMFVLCMLPASVVEKRSAPDNKTACPKDWFGNKCQYQCHCRTGRCNNDGSCLANDTCQVGWFDSHCQYADAAVNARGVSQSLTDQNNKTCLYDVFNITLEWPKKQLFTWMRVYILNIESLGNVTLHFQDGPNDQPVTCDSVTYNRYWKYVLDIACFPHVVKRRLVLKWKNAGFVCEVNVNGGRNMALKQTVNISSSVKDASTLQISKNLVDSERDAKCVLIDQGPDNARPYVSVVFDHDVMLTHLILSFGPHSNGLMSVQVVLNKHNTYPYNETFPGPFEKTTTLFLRMTFPVREVKVTTSVSFLHICEVEAIGDCFPTHHGLDCSLPCSNRCLGSRCNYFGMCQRCHQGTAGQFCETDTEIPKDVNLHTAQSEHQNGGFLLVILTLPVMLCACACYVWKYRRRAMAPVPRNDLFLVDEGADDGSTYTSSSSGSSPLVEEEPQPVGKASFFKNLIHKMSRDIHLEREGEDSPIEKRLLREFILVALARKTTLRGNPLPSKDDQGAGSITSTLSNSI